MLMQHNSLVVFKAYGEEEGNPEPGAQVPIHETPEFQETLKAELAKALAAETGGLKSKNSELKSERISSRLNLMLSLRRRKNWKIKRLSDLASWTGRR